MKSKSAIVVFMLLAAFAYPATSETLQLRSGKTVTGEIVAISDSHVILKMETGARMSMSKDQFANPIPKWLEAARANLEKKTNCDEAAKLCQMALQWDSKNQEAKRIIEEIECIKRAEADAKLKAEEEAAAAKIRAEAEAKAKQEEEVRVKAAAEKIAQQKTVEEKAAKDKAEAEAKAKAEAEAKQKAEQAAKEEQQKLAAAAQTSQTATAQTSQTATAGPAAAQTFQTVVASAIPTAANAAPANAALASNVAPAANTAPALNAAPVPQAVAANDPLKAAEQRAPVQAQINIGVLVFSEEGYAGAPVKDLDAWYNSTLSESFGKICKNDDIKKVLDEKLGGLPTQILSEHAETIAKTFDKQPSLSCLLVVYLNFGSLGYQVNGPSDNMFINRKGNFSLMMRKEHKDFGHIAPSWAQGRFYGNFSSAECCLFHRGSGKAVCHGLVVDQSQTPTQASADFGKILQSLLEDVAPKIKKEIKG
ncbi:MAG: hypothetical protein NTX50_25185 [Candidatus Sumerlaeota bacterium]|nr:hypothetical protein [Candidatus Sumerlaeota bacterium]